MKFKVEVEKFCDLFEIVCRKVFLLMLFKISKVEYRKMFEARVKVRDEMVIRER